MKVEEFVKSWKEVRGKTYEFLETVPEAKISWKPHKDLGTFGMQIRHIGVVQREYIRGIKSEEIDFEDKSFDKTIETNKKLAIEFLKKQDEELFELLKNIEENKIIKFHDGVYGTSDVKVETVLDWLIQHEIFHQGIFTCYGRIADLGKFRLM